METWILQVTSIAFLLHGPMPIISPNDKPRMTQSNQSVLDFLDGCMCPILKGGNNAIQLVSGHLGAGQRFGSLFQGYERRNPGKASWRSLRRGLLSVQRDTAVQRVRAAQVSLSLSEFLYFIVSMCTSHFVQHSHFYWGGPRR